MDKALFDQHFAHIDTWIFDLDNTLYESSTRLFDQVDLNMRTFLQQAFSLDADAAYAMQKEYYRTYGTTLRGLVEKHDIDPHDFLNHVHNIDTSVLTPDPNLSDVLKSLPGKRYIHTNGSVAHAINVSEALGIVDCFDGIFDILQSDYVPKPRHEAYQTFFAKHAIKPKNAAMFEDLARNLEVPKSEGMTTILIAPEKRGNIMQAHWEYAGRDAAYIDWRVDNLLAGLRAILPFVENRTNIPDA